VTPRVVDGSSNNTDAWDYALIRQRFAAKDRRSGARGVRVASPSWVVCRASSEARSATASGRSGRCGTRLLHRSADGGLAQEMAIGAASVVWDGAAVVDESVCVSTSSSVGWSSVAPGLVLLPCCRSDWPWSETA
jgi:hypothetical protein